MSRFLFHMPAPWMKTGYGQQGGLLAREVRDAGHEVTISSFGGLQGRSIDWEGITVLGGSREAHGNDFLGVRAAAWLGDGPGLILTFGDTWAFNPRVLRGAPVAMWTPVDTSKRMSVIDRAVISGAEAVPIAVSRHGEQMMTEAGLAPEYMPHAVDCSVFRPGDMGEARDLLEFPKDAFVIGFNGANTDAMPSRKALPQQLQAFARFRKKHPDAVMALHTRIDGPDGSVHLHDLSEDLGITNYLFYSDQIRYWEGSFSQEYLRTFYSACDVLSLTSFGEGFGLPLVEAQACGTPVVTSNHSAMRELVGPGWLVNGEDWWHNDHLSWWLDPSVELIARAYGKAYDRAGSKREAAREFALGWEVKRVADEHWLPVLERLVSRVVTRGDVDGMVQTVKPLVES